MKVTKEQIINLCKDFCNEQDVNVKVSFDMSNGYENAYDTYDHTQNTLFLNLSLLNKSSCGLFHVYHELRHAVQYNHPERFDKFLQLSLNYVVLYNGLCYKLIDGSWQEGQLATGRGDFINIYQSLPYELDANKFAYEKVKPIVDNTEKLEELYRKTLPERQLSNTELLSIFKEIDKKINRR